jgi:DNA-binding response OmpR family regulator
VLVIDDSRAIRQIILNILRQSSLFATYLEARDGSEGLEIAGSQSVDLILCDLDMPILDGFGFLARFRADCRNDPIPVLMLSATDHAKKRAEGLERGANDYIGKPCDPAELRARVRNYLRLKLLQDQLEAANRELARKNRELQHRALTAPVAHRHERRSSSPAAPSAPTSAIR